MEKSKKRKAESAALSGKAKKAKSSSHFSPPKHIQIPRETSGATPPLLLPQATKAHRTQHVPEPPRDCSGVSSKTQSSKTQSSKGVPKPSQTNQGRAKASRKEVREEVEVHLQNTADSSLEEEGAEAKPKAKRRRKIAAFGSKKGSWLSDVGSLLVLRCVQSALKRSQDYRESSMNVDWAEVRKSVKLTDEDMRTVWFLINKEFEGKTLEDIEWELKPYSSLSVDRIAREETKLKFKEQMPKPPVSAFLLYSASVSQKFKEKYPHLNQRQIATKIGEKWKSLPNEKQLQFRREYLAKREEYKKAMARFYEENPEAKPKPRTRRKADHLIEQNPEAVKIRELRSLKPKGPTTAYMLYCKAKRPSLQKKYSNLSSREITVKLSEKWKALDDTKKAKYRKQYIDYQCKYAEEMKKFYESHPGSKELLARKRKSRKETTSNGKLEKRRSRKETALSEREEDSESVDSKSADSESAGSSANSECGIQVEDTRGVEMRGNGSVGSSSGSLSDTGSEEEDESEEEESEEEWEEPPQHPEREEKAKQSEKKEENAKGKLSSNPVSKMLAPKKSHSEVPFSTKTISQEKQSAHSSPQKGIRQHNVYQLKGPLKVHSKAPPVTPQRTPGTPRVASTSASSSDSDSEEEMELSVR